MVDEQSKRKTERKLLGEKKSRNFKRRYRGGVHFFSVEHAWHFLDDGVTQWHYIHLYANGSQRPIKRWRWIEREDGSFEIV